MVRADEAVLCPACGARNKARWGYCVRCGESLQGAESAAGTAPRPAVFPDSPTEAAEPSSFLNGLLASVSALLMIVTVVVGLTNACRSGPPPPPAPAGLTVPTQPPRPSAAPAGGLATSPGQAAFQEGHRLLSAGDAAGGLSVLSQAVTEDAEKALFQWTYGEALIKTGELDAGLAAQGEAARLDPPRYRMEYAKSLGVNARRAEAVAEFEAVLEVSPNDPDALKGAGWYLCQSGDFARGLPLLRRAAEARPADGALFASLGAMAAANGQRQEAADAYWQAVQIQPANHEARVALASQLEKLGKGEDAVEVLRRGVAHSPTAASLHRDLGLLLERLRRPAEAAAALREYARLVPEAGDAETLRQKADRLDPAGAGT
jgi:Flp pilus assembly protein TadD